MAKLIYELEMSPENAGKIDAINKILLGADYTEEAPAKKPAETATAQESTTKSKASNATAKADKGIQFTEFRNAAKAAKSEFGEEFTMKVLKDCGVAVKDTLGRSISAASADQYEEIIAAWKAGPQESQEKELDDDDGLGDDDLDGEDEAEVDAEAVKTALKAYSKEHGRDEAKAIMAKHGAAALSKVDDLPAAKLSAMMKELV